MGKLQSLETFLQQHHPHIRCVTADSPDYVELRKAYILDNPVIPLAIVRPQSAEDVATLMTYAISAGIDITVRTGGHDIFGRCFVQDALAIDMREITSVRISENKSSATIGGGTLSGDLAAVLTANGLATAIGSIPSVGYVGWSTLGGYGQFVGNFGMGIDQIVQAKVVNGEGKIVHADADMMRAIRGAGGALGVIVEMTIKVYPLEKILAGINIFESSDITSTIQNFSRTYNKLAKEGLPPAFGLQPSVVNTPMGRCFVIGYMWSSPDLDAGRRYLEKVCSFGTVVHSGVDVMTIPEWQEATAAFVAESAYGGDCTVNVRELTDEISEVIGQQVEKMPDDPATLFSIHQLRTSAAGENEDSIFSNRVPHHCIEIIATSSDKGRAEEAWDWALGFRKALLSTSAENVVESTYIALTPPQHSSGPVMYGGNWKELVEIKERYDPKNVFRHALPNFN